MTHTQIVPVLRLRLSSAASVLVAALLTTSAVAAEDPAHKAATELVTLTKVEQTLAVVRQQIDESMASQIKAMEVPAGLKGKVEDYQKKVRALVAKEMNFASMKADYVNAYVEVFTPEELEGLVAFYETPVGKAFVEKQPDLTQKLIGLAQQRMEKIGPEVQKLNQGLVAEMQKEADKAKK